MAKKKKSECEDSEMSASEMIADLTSEMLPEEHVEAMPELEKPKKEVHHKFHKFQKGE